MSVISTALSGITAGETRLATAANNIANATTADFKAKQAVQTPLAGGGVRADVIERSPASLAFENAREALPNVSVDQELIEAKLASYDVQANLRVLKTQQELDQSLLDIQA